MNTPAPNITKHRNDGVDILRGLAILAVILLHLNIHFSYSGTFLREILPRQLFNLLFWSGYYGVVVFFTLSGYLITLSMIKKYRSLEHIKVKNFYLMRSARILPLLCTLLFILSVLHLLGVPGFALNTNQVSLVHAVFSALTFHINYLQIQVGYLPANWDVLWSISIEESFYLGFPLLCLLVRKEWQLVLLLSLFLFISPWARTGFFPANELGDRNHLAYLDSIAIGCIAALLPIRFKVSKHLQWFLLIVGSSLLILTLVFRGIVYKAGLTLNGLNISLLSFGAGMVLVWLHHHPISNKAWRIFSGLKHMGQYSYEIYLTHMFVVIVGAKLFNAMQLSEAWLIPAALVILVSCHFIGSVVFNYFSNPINQWLRQHFK